MPGRSSSALTPRRDPPRPPPARANRFGRRQSNPPDRRSAWPRRRNRRTELPAARARDLRKLTASRRWRTAPTIHAAPRPGVGRETELALRAGVGRQVREPGAWWPLRLRVRRPPVASREIGARFFQTLRRAAAGLCVSRWCRRRGSFYGGWG